MSLVPTKMDLTTEGKNLHRQGKFPLFIAFPFQAGVFPVFAFDYRSMLSKDLVLHRPQKTPHL
jgi:hypothetical protein